MLRTLALPLLNLLIAGTLAEVRSYNLTIHEGVKAPDGFPRPVYMINGQQPAPLIEAYEDDTLEVFVRNELPVETTLHWHGVLQRGTPQMDGVPGVTQYPILPGENFTYRFSFDNEYGFYWYHSHFRAYYSDSIRGALNVVAKQSRVRPFQSLATSDSEIKALLQAERDAYPVLLADWYHNGSDAVLQEYNRTGVFPHCVDSLLANAMGMVKCLPQEVLDCGPGLCLGPEDSSTAVVSSTSDGSMLAQSSTSQFHDMATMHGTSSSASTEPDPMMTSTSPMSPGMSMSPRKRQMMSMPDMSTALGPRGCTPPMMFRSRYNASNISPEICANSTTPLLTITAELSLGWLALNLVNAGSTSKLTVSLDSHAMYVYAADGLFVKLQRVEVLPIGLGERYSVMIRLDQVPDNYLLRFAATPMGDMQQVLEAVAVVRYKRMDEESVMDSAGTRNSSMTTNEMAVSMSREGSDGVHMLANSSAMAAASVLQPGDLEPFEHHPPPQRGKVTTKHFNISQTGIVTWSINNTTYVEPKVPILNGNSSDGWDADTTLHVPFNATIDLMMRIAPDSMDMMGHPMHLHGHKFWVLGSGKGDLPYSTIQDVPSQLLNLDNPPYRDTVELPASGWAIIRYVSDNPGAWLFHCHVQWHLVSGMALVLVEGDDRLPPLLASYNASTTSPEADPTSATQSKSLAYALTPSLVSLTAFTGFYFINLMV